MLQQEELLAYIKGEISIAEKERIAKIIATNPFMKDAYEGLLASNLIVVAEAQKNIHQQLKKEIVKSKKSHFNIFQNNIWIICLILILCIVSIGFYIIKNMK